MKMLIDDYNIQNIKKLYEYYPIDGVTTNPSILSKSGGNPFKVLKEIRSFIGESSELHVQVVSKFADGMIKDAKRIIDELGQNTYVKIPSIPEGFKAMKILNKEDIKITATAIYTPMQAYLAAKCGALYAAPYINRIDNMGFNGVYIAKSIHDVFKNNDLNTKILAASFKNSMQVLELCKYGIGAVTVSADIIDSFVSNHEITAAIDNFIIDFESVNGKGSSMSTC